MANKDLSKISADDLRVALKEEQDRSDVLQKDKESRDAADAARQRDDNARARADSAAARSAEPSEDQWVKLESEYDMTRDEIKKSWKLIQNTTRPLQAAIATYQTRDAAAEAVRLAKEGVKAQDPQFPKFERFVDEYLSDIPLSDKADPDIMKRHMDRAVHFAKGKARATDKNFREDHDETREIGVSADEKANADQGFGEFAIAGMPLTITNEKLVPDDFRKRHSHPDQKEGVRMNERSRWAEGVPKKPR